ncbi:putative Domain found in IF2B IF5 [Trypanosoma vivax]|uniref:Putative translation initiation factor n=1 Tax=Trypanosoma vivax (strain Y486) TaxID=1055687 RepID=G0TVT3_TRYVY|nr:putative Domain found in IF2B IF5 [Trypanosoma vivax]CCC48049.1 putative translation initiation factor [Trypanosoma vivax Y486]
MSDEKPNEVKGEAPAKGRRRKLNTETTAALQDEAQVDKKTEAGVGASAYVDPAAMIPGVSDIGSFQQSTLDVQSLLPPQPSTAPDAGQSATKSSCAADIFDKPYDSFTPEDLYALLESTRFDDVMRLILEREKQISKEHRGPHVERFLDTTHTTRAGNSSSNNNSAHGNNAGQEESLGYSYSSMLSRIFELLNRTKDSSALSERNQLPVPQVERIGKKKVVIVNFPRICEAFHRPIEDVKDYIEKELSVRGNLDSSDALILKYEVQKATAFDKIFIKYLDEYVKCNACHKIDTTLTKEGRRIELRCNWCTATRSVQTLGSATYSAQVGKRSRARRQAMTL